MWIFLFFRDTSVESLQFLNVDQALADLAYFVKHIKKTIPGNTINYSINCNNK